MRPVAQLRLPQFDPADPGLTGRRWHRQAGRLLESGHWLARSPSAVVVLEREAAEFFLRSGAAVVPGWLPAERSGVGSGPLRDRIAAGLINLEGGEHRRLRGLLNPSLSPRAVNRRRPEMRATLEDLWAELPGDRFDFVRSFSRPYPALAIARVVGAPAMDATRLRDWASRWQRQFDSVALSDPATVTDLEQAMGEFREWIVPLIAARREEPGEDLVTDLTRSEENGETLSDDEITNLILDLLVGGIETIEAQLSHGVRLLAGSPEMWTAIRRDPEGMVPRTVAEILRFEPAIPFTARRLEADVTCRDVLFPAGTVLMICAYTGNRDPATFECPAEFDPLRERGQTRSLSFGAGIHYCAGANLARAELEEALGFLAGRIERIELADEPDLQPVFGIYGTDSLEIRISAAAPSGGTPG